MDGLNLNEGSLYICVIIYYLALVNASQCYFCDTSHSVQGDVTDPDDCITFTTCDSNQVRTHLDVTLAYIIQP